MVGLIVRARRALALLAAATLLAGCALPDRPDDSKELKPLARQPAVPAGAPRSRVSTIYDLAGPDDGPQDGPDGAEPGKAGEIFQRGGASWYGPQFHNRKTANGERFDMTEMTAAHRTLPFNTRVCVRSLVNGREVLVRINDRGPFAAGRIIDLSRAAAEAIDMIGLGIKQVALTVIDEPDMRCNGETVAPAPPSTVAPGADAPARKKAGSSRAAPRRKR